MAFAERATEVPSRAKPCKVARLLETLEPAEAEGLLALMGQAEDREHPRKWVAVESAVRDEGYDASDSALKEHHRRLCTCYR